MQKLIDFFKKHKILFILALFIVVGLIAFIVFSPNQAPTPPPVKTEPQNVFDTSTFKLESVYPPEEPRATIDSFEYLKFTFSKPVDVNKVVVTASPAINLVADIFEDEKVLIIRPEKDFWKVETDYTITISNIVATDGTPLGTDIRYSYFNSPPTDIKIGEPR